ncbi:galactose oxidase [Hymenobacter sp. HMF4947]|uniref:Galactose oxidase n=1 Tax=Hymenobacter ginkgonis TaxID=2682976 RepID=A0A7K1THJ0_9BACT|nr:kelch repeat-containing protein [Hymenobacter ginkgonis]MVN77631.1 galactose oxidase [Hymenobacter ginkgonis]
MKNFPRLAVRLLAMSLVLGGLSLSSCKKDDTTTVTGDWTTGNSFAGTARNNSVSFVINNIAYVGTGIDASSNIYNDLYSYNPATGGWNKLTPMPAAAGVRYRAVAFVAGGKGYVGTGYNGSKALSDFWQFDPAGSTSTTTNGVTTTTSGSWKQVADLTTATGGTARYWAVAGSVSDMGYVGCGYDGNYEKDFYKYNPTTDKWSVVNNFPGDKRMGGLTFTINGEMYVATGINNNQYNTDVSSYNPVSDTWTVHRNLKNQTTGSDIYDYSAVARAYAGGFVVNNLAYVTVGSNTSVRTDCFVYDPAADTWTLKNPFLGSGRNYSVSFGINGIGYVGLGSSGTSSFDDFWKFAPDADQE